jgi:hypothetical protein
VVYLLVEPESPFTDLSAIPVRRELIKRFERPWDGMAVELYQVFVLENDQAEAQRARLLLIREFPQKTPQPFIHLLRGRDAA